MEGTSGIGKATALGAAKVKFVSLGGREFC